MENNTWVPMVLKDVEMYCHQNGLLEIALHLEEVRLKFKRLQNNEKLAVDVKKKDTGQIKLVWSQAELPEKDLEKLLVEHR